MKNIILISFLLLFIGCNKNSYQNMTASEVYENRNNTEFLIIDVRSRLEYKNDHIENAINVVLEELEENIEGLVPDKDRKIIVYCQSGKRSEIASEKLVHLGYKNIYNLAGGISAYEEVNQ